MDKLAQTMAMSDSEQQSIDPNNLVGQLVAGDFQVLRRIGQGGMGQVYLAEQKSLTRKVALKILREDVAARDNARKRFEVEAKAVANATHSNIVQVYAFGEWNGFDYMALEYVDGWNLREYLNRKGTPDLPLALSILRQSGSALQRAGELGITHRDIKPENILLTRKGEVKVADFGLSRDDQQPLNLTQNGVTMGTPLYMSPEQVEGKAIDPRSDIYSLGVTVYHMLSGEPPFKGESPFEVALAHVQKEAAPLYETRPDLPPELCQLVHRMMEKDPDNRYQTAREMLNDLSPIRSKIADVTQELTTESNSPSPSKSGQRKTKPESTKKLSATKRKRKKRSSNKMPWIVAISVMLALSLGAGIAWMQSNSQPKEGTITPASHRVSLSEQAQQRRKVAEGYLSSNDNKKTATGSAVCVELGLQYVRQNRLPEAEAWFNNMVNSIEEDAKNKEAIRFQVFGYLGLAVVESMRDNAKDSTDNFFKAFSKTRTAKRPPLLRDRFSVRWYFDNAELKKWIATAIKRNKINDPVNSKLPNPLINLFGERINRP